MELCRGSGRTAGNMGFNPRKMIFCQARHPERCEAPRKSTRVSSVRQQGPTYLACLAAVSLCACLLHQVAKSSPSLPPTLGVGMRTLPMMANRNPYWRGLQSTITRVFLGDIIPRHARGWYTRWPRWTVRPRGLAVLVRRCTRSQNVPQVDRGNGPELLRRACEIRRSAFS